VQKRRDGVAMNIDHLQIGQTVDATHAQSHDAQYEGETWQRSAEWYDDHADRHNSRADQ